MGLFNLSSFLTGGGGLPGLESMWGGSLYRSSGAESSAKQQYKHQLALQHDAQNFAKWQMGNAHQMEVQDLQNAGLNPVLSAGGQGASAGVTEGTASAGNPIIDPISAVSQIVSTMNNAKATNAQVDKIEAEARNLEADTANKKQTFEWTPQLNKSLIKLQEAQSTKAKAEAVTEVGKQLAYQFDNKMREMNVNKRSKAYFEEVQIYEKQMRTELTMAGYNMSDTNMAIKKFGEYIKAISPFGDMVPNVSTNYNVTTNYAPN